MCCILILGVQVCGRQTITLTTSTVAITEIAPDTPRRRETGAGGTTKSGGGVEQDTEAFARSTAEETQGQETG